jgi:hypothetical protein
MFLFNQQICYKQNETTGDKIDNHIYETVSQIQNNMIPSESFMKFLGLQSCIKVSYMLRSFTKTSRKLKILHSGSTMLQTYIKISSMLQSFSELS